MCSIAGNNTLYSIVNGNGINSRRQSNIPRIADNESTCSLQGLMQRDSVKSVPRNKAIDRLPLYLNALEQPESMNKNYNAAGNLPSKKKEQLESTQKKPLAMVRPRQILSTNILTSGDNQCFRSCTDFESSTRFNVLRESISLDPFPNQLRRRLDCKKLLKLKSRNRSACSLDACVAIISPDRDQNYREDNIIDGTRNRLCVERCYTNVIEQLNENRISATSTSNNMNISAKHLNNNCNSPTGTDDVNCPLLQRQGSLNNPHDDILLHHKRWRSLETIGGLADADVANIGHDNCGGNKKALSRNSIRSWLFGLFQGSGFRSNDASLRKVGTGIMQTSGVRGFTELPPATEHESIV